MSSYVEAITKFYPGLEVSISGDMEDYNNLVVHKGGPLPPKAELDQKVKELRQDEIWRLIQSERDSRRAGGVQVNGYWFHSDDTSRIQHLGLLSSGQNLQAGIMWKTMSGVFVEMTPALAVQIFSSVMQRDVQIFTVAEQKRQAMSQLEDPRTYDWASGWPAVYGE